MKQSSMDESTRPLLRSPLLTGIAVVLGTVLAGSLILAILLRFSTVAEADLPYFTYGINGVALVSGGWLAGRRAGYKGWLYGGMTGILYVLIVLIVGFLAFDASMRVQPFLFTVCATGLSTLGGIFGVNTRKP
ncbi:MULTISPECIES: TIGR04086 family membrane protein [Kroppenstedtia]|uniref:TIGR04086 family membrane protein n=2 Tax=Kroppenstedtia TaxID=1274351 RepID=A0ABW4CAK2_9BACL|nr:TIGR04086 family membrane protein [Kroppenstedtia eburnea]EGK14560.1 putative YrzE [Desmospora sp. 8437]SIS81868.1 putative membrane protein, TIGR04086 family [Kroppenstedtia eburnea]